MEDLVLLLFGAMIGRLLTWARGHTLQEACSNAIAVTVKAAAR